MIRHRLSIRKGEFMRHSAHTRKTVTLSQSIQHQLNMYALAAGAAGVGVLALAHASEAKIVYTPTNVTIGGRGGLKMYKLDFNGDGITDIKFQSSHSSFNCDGSEMQRFLIFETAVRVNGVVGRASALSSGAVIGANRQFYGGRHYMEQVLRGGRGMFCFPSSRGPWRNTTDRYLGVKFKIRGKTHFGWARLSVGVNFFGLQAKLTGYAYETIPGKSIIAGKTHTADDGRQENNFQPDSSLTSPTLGTVHPASLGMLAVGAGGIAVWRRKEEVEAV
jgi:hypothetical protein